MKKLICAVTVLAVSTAQADLGVCGDPAAGDCCVANGTPACENLDCCQAVCAIPQLAYCCEVGWDNICAKVAVVVCEIDCRLLGACCLSDGSCVNVSSPAECNELGGAFQGLGTSCVVPCAPCVTGVIAVPKDEPTIQGAIQVACGGTEIVVAPGTYFETINFLGKAITLRSSDGPTVTTISANGPQGADSTVTCDSGEGPDTVIEGFTITGGTGTLVFTVNTVSAGGGMLNLNGSSPTVTNCTFSGNTALGLFGRGGGMYNQDGSSPTVTDCTFSGNSAKILGGGMSNYGDSSPTVTDCTFTSNSAAGAFHIGSGGGMSNSSGSSPTVTDCTFSGNTATGRGSGMSNFSNPTVTNCTFSGNTDTVFGGGMYNSVNSPTVTNCTFSGNSATVGGGMYNSNGSSPTVTNCSFSGNTAIFVGGGASRGGGMYNNISSPTVTDCTFIGNSANSSGGAMQNFQSSPTVTNCTFIGNSANSSGGGMDNFNSSPTVTNCSFSGNLAMNGHALAFDSLNLNLPSDLIMTNCILWDGGDEISNTDRSTLIITYTDVQGGSPGTGNIDADPLFVDPVNGDFRLSPGSPCIDAGDNTAVPVDITTDLDGNPRFVDDPDTADTGNGDPPVVDMGAYEFQGIPCPWDLDGDGNVFVTDLLILLGDFGSCDGSPADFDGDGCVTVVDLLTLLGNWGPCPGSDCVWDVNDDGTVDQTDLRLVLGNFGPCDGCPEDVNGDGVVNGQDAAQLATHFGPCP